MTYNVLSGTLSLYTTTATTTLAWTYAKTDKTLKASWWTTSV